MTDKTQRQCNNFICSLPDSLLLRILSFLPVEEVIKTSLLARRWRKLWRSVPCLDFSSFCSRFYAKPNLEVVAYIYMYLMLCEAPKIERFCAHFNYKDASNAHHIDAILRFLVEHGIDDLQLSLGIIDDAKRESDVYVMHTVLSKCTTLKKFSFTCYIKNTAWLSFKSLKTLHLCSMIDTNMLNTSSCPLLEDLILECCFKNHLEVHAPNKALKHLKIKFRYRQDSSQSSLAIYAPHVLEFENTGWLPRSIDIKNLSSITSAKFDWFCHGNYHFFSWRTDFFRKISHLKTLKFSFFRALFSGEKWKIPPLDVISLELYSSSYFMDIHGIAWILYCCQHLESLTLDFRRLVRGETSDEGVIWNEFVTASRALAHLKTLRIRNFICCGYGSFLDKKPNMLAKHMEKIDEQITPIKVLLNICPKLEKMEIRTGDTSCRMSEKNRLKFCLALSNLLLSLPRASPNAQVNISCR